MTPVSKRILSLLCALVLVAGLGGCGGYARQSGGGSSVETYGTTDAGVYHGNR